jgi:hypothetical protein
VKDGGVNDKPKTRGPHSARAVPIEYEFVG